MKKLLYIITALSAVLYGSCATEVREGRNAAADKLRVALEVEDLTIPANTRASIPAEEGETTVESLYLLFFAPDAAQNGAFINSVNVPVNDMAPVVDLSQVAGITATGQYNILAVANLADRRYVSLGGALTEVDTWLGQLTGKTQKEVMQQAAAMVTIATGDANAIMPDQLLMSASVAKPAGSSEIDLLLTRGVVRFDVYNEQSANYELVSASIWNAYKTTPIWTGAGMVDYSGNVERTARYYGVENTQDLNDPEPPVNIIGGLYTFENQSAAPAANDKLTTCLIVGLRSISTGKVLYYRANMVPQGSSQMLIRNYVYRLNILGVSAPGFETEEMAYNGRGHNLIYTVGKWNMDDNGLIVQDENSIMSLPTKTINIGREAETVEYSIFINSKLPDAGPLKILNQIYDPSDHGIRATIDGNILRVAASALANDQNERRGIITLEYAGLQTAVNVIQSGEAVTYLNIILPEGGIPPFLPFGNLPSGLVNIDASGPWTARMIMDGFSFAEGRLVTEIHSTSVQNNQFRIYTNTANPETGLRKAIVVVELDSDPERYSGAIPVSQKAPGIINISPDQGVVLFNVGGDLFVPLQGENVNTFNVLPNKVAGEGGVEYIPEWKAEIVQSGMYDDRAMFRYTIVSTSETIDADNIITVEAVGPNYKGRMASAVMRVSLTNEPGTYTDITLNQASFEWRAPYNQDIPGKGGTTGELKIDIPAEVTGLHYTVEIQSFEPMEYYGNAKTQQFAYLIDGEDTGATPTRYISLQPNDISVGFKVGFPSMPMSLIRANVEPTVTIAVRLVETGETKTFTVTQEVMEARPVRAMDVGAWRHGNLIYASNTNSSSWNTGTNNFDATYQEALANFFENATYFGPTGTVKTNGLLGTAGWRSGTDTWNALKNEVTFVNYASPAYTTSQFANSYIYEWLQTDSGFTIINSEGGSAEGALDYSSSYILGQLGLKGGGGYMSVASATDWNYTGNEGFRINPDDTNPIIDYLVNSGPFGAVDGWRNLNIGNSGVNGYTLVSSIEPALGTDAVPILQMTSRDTEDATGELVSELVIDPSLNLMIKNDSELYYDTTPTGARRTFLLNLAAFMINTAQYGSVFTNEFWDNPANARTMPQPQQ